MPNDFSGDSDCVAVWNHDDGALTTDSQGGNTLTNNGVSAETGDYKQGDASGDYEDSSSDYQSIADADCDAGFPLKSGDTGKKITILMWVKLETAITSGYDGLIGKWNTSPNRCWAIHLRGVIGGPYVGWYWSSNGINFEMKESQPQMSAGRWYHIAVTYDDSTKAWGITVYDDSISTKYTNSGNGVNNIALNAVDLEIGHGAGTDYFDGLIDEVVIFKRILTSDEIDSIRSGSFGVSGNALFMGAEF